MLTLGDGLHNQCCPQSQSIFDFMKKKMTHPPFDPPPPKKIQKGFENKSLLYLMSTLKNSSFYYDNMQISAFRNLKFWIIAYLQGYV